MSDPKNGSVRRGKNRSTRNSAAPTRRLARALGIEALESRTLLAVTPTLNANTGVLDIALGAANDKATVSVVGLNLDVFDGTTHVPFAVTKIQGLNVHGTGAKGQSLVLHSAFRFGQTIQVSQLASTTVDGAYQAASIDMASTEIHVKGGLLSTRNVAPGADPLTANSTGNSGTLLLSGATLDVAPGSKILANANNGFMPGTLKMTAIDNENGENINSAATIKLNNAIVRAGDVFIDATAMLTATASKPLNSNGASIANLDVTSTATVDVIGTTEVSASGDLNIGAHSTATTTANALASSNSSSTSIDAAFAKTKLNSTAQAHVGGSATLSAHNLMSIMATNNTNAATTADGSSAGSNAGGASVAIADVTTDTEAFANGSATLNAGLLRIAAVSDAKANTAATATSKAVTQNTGQTKSTLSSQNAKSADGPIDLAAAVGVTTFNDTTLAKLATSSPVTVIGDLKLDSKSTAASSAKADASTAAANGQPTGEGVAVAVDHATETNRASIDGSGPVKAKGIAVTASTLNGPNSFDAEALSGKSAQNSSLEGAAAFNIASSTNEAFLASGSNTNAANGDVVLNATGDVTSTASAMPAPGGQPGSPASGMGASLAINILSDLTRAEVENNAALTGASNLTLGATGHEGMTTTAEAGADIPGGQGGNSSGFSAAVGINLINATTTARVGTDKSGNVLSLGGNLSLAANHQATVTNNAGGNAAGQGVLGAAVALNVTSANTTATLARDLDAPNGNTSIATHADLASAANATASARGGKTQDANNNQPNGVDKESNAELDLANKQATSQGVAGTNGAQAPQAKTGGGGATVAGALAINLVTASTSEATIANGKTAKMGGNLSLTATNDTDASAKADGNTTDANATGVGVGIALNAVSGQSNRAIIGSKDNVLAKSLTLDAHMSNTGDGTNVIRADATSGAGAKETGVAGSLAINVAKLSSEAYVSGNAQVTLTGGDLVINAAENTSAPASARPGTDPNSGGTRGVGLSFAVNVIEDSTLAEVSNNASVAGSKNVGVTANSTDDLSSTAQTGIQAKGSAYAAAVAVTALTAPTTARLGTGSALAATGDVSVSATHGGSAIANSGEAAQSPDTSLGAAVSIAVVTTDTVATTLRDVSAPSGAFRLTAKNHSFSDAVAKATSKGGKADDGSASSTAADDETKSDLSQADDAGNSVNAKGTNGATAPKSETSDGGTTVAGALAVDIVVSSRAEASIADGLTIKAGGQAALLAANDTDAHASADGSATDAASTGVGVGIAINAAPNIVTRATVGSNANVTAKGLSLTAAMNDQGDQTHTIGAEALAGAGAKKTGVAGALAINVAKVTTEAVLSSKSTTKITGGADVLLAAHEHTAATARATPTKDPATGDDKGIGVSAAFNIVEEQTRAELVNDAVLVGANNVHLDASSRDDLTTTAEAGAQSDGGTAFAGSVAAAALTSTTKARFGSGSALSATGDVVAESFHADTITTEAGGTGKSSTKAIGVAIGFTYESADTTATTDRDISQAGAVTFMATNASASDTAATASEAGGQASGPPGGAKQQGDAEKSELDEKASETNVQGTSASASTPDAKTSNGDSIAFAGALAIDIVGKSHANATIPNGRSIHASGPLTLHAANDVDSHTKADGSATGDAKTGVGVALAITAAPDVQTYATIGSNASVTAHGINLTADMTPGGDGIHVVGAEATSGASASDSAGAGALALSVFLPKTSATVGSNSTIDPGAGDFTLHAEETTRSTVAAKPTQDKVTGKSLGVGLSFAFNIVEEKTTAEVADSANVKTAHDVHVFAGSSDILDTSASAGATATGGGNGGNGGNNGGTGVAASVAASAVTSTTTAHLGSGLELATTNGGAVTVEVSHKDTVKTDVGADSKGGETAIGVAIGLSYESVDTTAKTDRDINAAGAVSLVSHNASATDTEVKASGAGGSGKSQNNSPTGVHDQSVETKNALDDNTTAAAPNAQGTDPNTQIPDAKNADNESMVVAGAIALDLPVKVHSLATIPANRSIHAGGLLTVASDNDVDAKSNADGTAVGQATTGVGVGVAITVAPDVQNMATIGHNATIVSTGLVLSAEMSPDNDQLNVIRADAISGASAADKAGSGAFALDIFLEKTDATIGHDTTITAGGGDVTISAVEATDSTVNAIPAVDSGGPGGGAGGTAHGKVLGVGVSVALNIVEIEANATVANTVVVSSAHDVSLNAHSTDTLNTKATAGGSASSDGSDSTGVGAEAALSILVAKTNATIGKGGSVDASHDISAHAEHVDKVTTTGDGAGAGADTAVGIAIGFTYVDAQTNATVGEDITAGHAITLAAKNATASSTTSYASAKGGKDKDDNQQGQSVDATGQKNRDLADSYATDAGGQPTDANVKDPQAKTSGGSIAVAGALAINVVANSKAIASTADGKAVHANGGPLTISALNDTDAHAVASGSATEQATTGVGVAVALNVAPTVVASATVGKNSDIRGQGIAIKAGMSDANDSMNQVGANAISGASASKKAGAGGLGLSLFFDTTEAVAQQGAHLDAQGGDVSITANSQTNSNASALPTKGAGGKTIGVGVSVGIGVIEEKTRGEIEDTATLVGANGLAISATSHDGSTVSAEAGAQATGGDAGAGAAAVSIVVANTSARVGTGNDIHTTGAIAVESTHTGDTLATVSAAAKGSDTVVGISLGINYIDAGTTADIHRNMSTDNSFTIAAHTESSGAASALASTAGAKGEDNNSSSTGVDQAQQTERDSANSQISDNGGQSVDTSQDTSAKTSEGGVSVAGALGLNIVHVHSEAIIPDNLTIDAGGPLVVSAWNDADGSAYADGQAAGGAKKGVGVAVAINYVEADAAASIGVDTIHAGGVTVEATQGSGIHQENYSAWAISGAGKSNTGVAGSVALNLVKSNSHNATIASGASIDAKGGDVSVVAASTTTDTAKAVPADGGGVATETGVGASVAVNIVLKDVHADINDNADVINVGTLNVSADSPDTLTTLASNGAQGDTAVGVSAAVTYIKNETTAHVGTGADLHASGDATIHALIDDTSTTTADSVNIGGSTAVGVSIGVGILRTNADASLSRNLSADGAIGITADSTTTSQVHTTASAVGVPKQVLKAGQMVDGENSDERSGDQFGFLNSLSGQNESSSDASLKNSEDSANGTTTQQTGSQSKDSLGVAATIAVSVEHVDVHATVAPSLSVIAKGATTIATTAEVDGATTADSLAVQIQQGDSTTVAAAVAVNVPIIHENTLVGAGSTVQGAGITIAARQAQGTTDDFTSRALSGAAGTGDAGAGSASVIVAKINTTAIVDNGSHLTSTGGVDVVADNLVIEQNLAGGGAVGKGNGAGIAIVITDFDEHTTEAIVGASSTVESAEAMNVTATASITPLDGDLPGDPSAGAVGIAATTDTNVGGSIIVDVVNQTTLATIGDGVHINDVTVGGPDQSVHVAATSTLGVVDAVGGVSASGGSGVGVGLLVHVAMIDTEATIGDHTRVTAKGDVTVKASSTEHYFGLGVAGGIASENAVSVTAVVFVPTVTTKAHIGGNSRVDAMGNVIVGALHDLSADLIAGALSIGAGSASVGAEVASLGLTATTEAYIGSNSLIYSHGETVAAFIPTGFMDDQGNILQEPVHGTSVTAVGFERVKSIAVGGSISGGTAVSGSAAVNVYNLTTKAHIDHGTIIDAADNVPGTGPSLHVLASDRTKLTSAGGALAGGSNAGVGVGVDVGVITKNTQSYIDAFGVIADSDVFVKANSSEDIQSFSASLSAASSGGIAGSAGVYVVNVTTRAFIGYDASNPESLPGIHAVVANGNVDVAARESFSLLLISGSVGVGGSAGIGAGAAVPIVTKTTEAFIGADTGVAGRALGGTIDADTGEFGVSYTAGNGQLGDADPSKDQENRKLDKQGKSLPTQGLENTRHSTPTTRTMKGVAVTATNRDDLQVVGASAGAAGSVSVAVAGAIDVLTNHTTAHVDNGALINPTILSAGPDQSIQIAAGNDLSLMGIAAGLSVAGSAAVTAGATIFVANQTTKAYAEDGASLTAKRDIAVEAHAAEDIITVAATVSGSGGASVGGAVSTVVLNDTTYAKIGDAAGSDAAGAVANAGGNIFVAATDDSQTLTVAGGVAIGGGLGIGGSVGVAVFNKDTQARVGNHATVNAGGNSAPLTTIYEGTINPDGTFATLGSFRGLAVQAGSTEQVFQVGATASGGLYFGLGGGVSVELFKANTQASIGDSANVNTDPALAGQDQSVNVAAVDHVSDFSLGGGIGVGVVGIGGGIDIGILRNNTSACIGRDAEVHATGNIDVIGLSSEDITSYGISGAGGLGAIAGSLSIWSVGSDFKTGYSDDANSDDSVKSKDQNDPQPDKFQQTTKSSDGMAGAFKNVTADYLDPKKNAALGPVLNIGGVKQGTDDPIDNDAKGGQVESAAQDNNPTAGTSAEVQSGVILVAGGGVGVRAADKLSMNVADGSVAVGFVGVGGAIAIVDVQSHVSAKVGSNVTIDAGGDVFVTALFTEQSSAFVLAGKGGIAALGAEVVVFHDTSTQEASVGSDTQITRAGNIGVFAAANRNVDGETLDAGIGGLAVGATYVEVNLGGSTTATVADGVKIGQKPGIMVTGGLFVDAFASNSVTDKGYAFEVGVLAGSGNHTDATINPVISATIGNNTGIDVQGVIDVQAISFGAAKTDLLNSTGGGLSVTVMISHVTVSPELTAAVGTDATLHAGGSITVGGSHNYDQNGAVLTNLAEAHALAPSGSAISGTGVETTATANATINATVGTGTTLKSGGTVEVVSSLSNNAKATSETASLGALGIGVSLATATANGSSNALMDGDIDHASNVRVESAAANHANADSTGLGASAIAQAIGAFATANASPTIEARIGNGAQSSHVTSDNGVNVAATSESDAGAGAHALVIGGLAALGEMSSTATLDPTVSASIGAGSSVTAVLGSINVAATHNADGKGGATAESDAPGGAADGTAAAGLFSGLGANSSADASPEVNATVGLNASLSSRSNIFITSTSVNNASAETKSLTISGFAAVGSASATATANGTNTAYLDGKVTQAVDLSVVATGTNVATANADATSGSLLASGAGADATATVNPKISSRIGTAGNPLTSTSVHVQGDITLGAESISNAEAHGHTAVGGILGGGIGIVHATATATPTTKADVGSFADVETTGGLIYIYARHDEDKRQSAWATAESPGIGGLVSGVGAVPTATATPDTEIHIGDRTKLVAPQEVSIGSISSGIVEATADSSAVGFGASFGTTYITATSNGTTKTVMDGTIKGGIVTVSASSTDSAHTAGTSTAVGIVSGDGVISTCVVATHTTAQVGEDTSSGSIHSTGQATVSASAQETSKAEAKATSVGGIFSLGLSSASADMTSEVGAVLWKGSSIVSDEGTSIVANLTLPHVGMSAEAYSESPGGGLLALNGAVSHALATPTVYARADQDTKLNATNEISVSANSKTTTQAIASSLSVGLVSVGGTLVDATSSAHTAASVLGKIETGASLDLSSTGNDRATAQGEAAAGGLGAGAGTSVTATVLPFCMATLGNSGDVDSTFSLTNDANVKAHETASGSSEAGSIALGFAALGFANAKSLVAPQVHALIANSATVKTLAGDVLVSATLDGAESKATAHATGDGALGGIQSTVATMSMLPSVSASALPSSTIDAGGDVTFNATATINASSRADGSAFSLGVGAGGTSATTTIGGSTIASAVNVAYLAARGNLSLTANDTTTANSYAQALGGGVLTGVAGSDAKSTINRSVDAALDSNGGPVVAFGATTVDAEATETSISTADGTAGGAVGVGTSKATSVSTPSVTAVIGPGTSLTSVGPLLLKANGTHELDATANTSAGGIAGVNGSEATMTGNLTVTAHIAGGDSIHAGRITIDADGTTNVTGLANGQSIGGAGIGGQASKVDLNSTVLALVDDATDKQLTDLVGNSGITIDAHGHIDGSSNTVGGAGGFVGAGGASNAVIVHAPLVRASIGDNAHVNTQGDLALSATDYINISSKASQSGGGAGASEGSSADAEIADDQPQTWFGETYTGELLLADLGKNVTGNVGNLRMDAAQSFVNVVADARAEAFGNPVVIANANATANACNNSIVHIDTGTNITATNDVKLHAYGPLSTFTSAYAETNAVFLGIPGPGSIITSDATAFSDKISHDCVIIEPGAQLNAVNLSSESGANPPLGPKDNYSSTQVGKVDGIGGSGDGGGSQMNEACDDIFANMKLIGTSIFKLHITPAGLIDALEGLTVTDATGEKTLGQTVTGPFVVGTLGRSAPVGTVLIHATDGDTTGHSLIEYDPTAQQDIVNESRYSMTFDRLATFKNMPPQILHETAPDEGLWTYTLVAREGGGSTQILTGGDGTSTSPAPVVGRDGGSTQIFTGGDVGTAISPTPDTRGAVVDQALVALVASTDDSDDSVLPESSPTTVTNAATADRSSAVQDWQPHATSVRRSLLADFKKTMAMLRSRNGGITL